MGFIVSRHHIGRKENEAVTKTLTPSGINNVGNIYFFELYVVPKTNNL